MATEITWLYLDLLSPPVKTSTCTDTLGKSPPVGFHFTLETATPKCKGKNEKEKKRKKEKKKKKKKKKRNTSKQNKTNVNKDCKVVYNTFFHWYCNAVHSTQCNAIHCNAIHSFTGIVCRAVVVFCLNVPLQRVRPRR